MKKLTDDKKIKLYEEVCPVALKYRESFIQKSNWDFYFLDFRLLVRIHL